MQQKKEVYLITGAATDGAPPAARHRIITAMEKCIIDIVEIIKR